ncbi:ABC-F family ATP-binding cassette domain-containing protein [Bacteroides fragilis]|uniref:ABC-F family ATP-binding cassette domain-containing protein n=1 Tax=Bacteroides fragilis TaxID=817 RepID=UPI0020302186|nr:ABC-F family ATP-binding cassette domain-containing protein [Bacteroides fragilis]MCM0234359.1 ABC-F family ATP-binding cassette domain-containing protein [Bacteroides fragilis]
MCIQVQQITYIHPDKEVLFQNLSFSVSKGQQLALIGNNGCGKSTLLQIISGQLQPCSGTVLRPFALYYVPQHFGQYDKMSIAEALGIDGKRKALHAILDGDTSIVNFNILDDDWNIEEKTTAALNGWGLGTMSLDQPMHTLSGGEKTRVFLAGIELQETSVILMDEPTNHLDSQGRNKLYEWVKKCRSTLIVVSHDRTLLNLLPETCELSRSALVFYGGNYEFYKQQKELLLSALQQQLNEKEKELRQVRKLAREVAERKDKQNVRSEKAAPQKGISRMAINTLKDRAEKSTTKLADIHRDKSEKLVAERSQIRNRLGEVSLLKTDFNASALHPGKILLTARDINFTYEDSFLWEVPLSFQLKSGDRIRIEGDNGSGKTTLLKLVTGELLPASGTLERTGFSYVYLNQEYSIISDGLTVLQQAESFNLRNLPEHEIKIILNRFLFPVASWDKPCKQLSGGEKMRLAFCCLMISNNTPDLFILDEPTNNLDIHSIEIITATIRNYTGSVLLVSHDEYFIKETGMKESIFL